MIDYSRKFGAGGVESNHPFFLVGKYANVHQPSMNIFIIKNLKQHINKIG